MFTKKNLLLLISRHVLIAFSVILLCFICVIILSREIEEIADSVTKNRKLASALEERTALLTQLSRDAQTIGTNESLIVRAFVPSDNVIEFISALESMALKNGVSQTFKFNSPSPSTIASPFPLSTISYSNTLTINLPTLIQYMKDLENLPFFTKVESLHITSQSDQGLQGATSASFNATLYTKSTQ
jgi:uncharacterized protein YpmS